jgi:serine/threonine-protein kinase
MGDPQAIGADDQDLLPGQRVGEYLVEEKIGAGGFGTVFRAVHPVIGKLVAIKVLKRQYSAQPEMVSRFVAEARAVNQIRHRNIIDIFGFGQLDDGRHYYVMEFLEGQPLDEYLAGGPRLGLSETIAILRPVARALDAAHGKGIAHRDLKPENIFLARDPDGGAFPKLLDFGIAKLLQADSGAMHKTRTGAPIGTPYYMSPEQCRGKDVDHRTDIYAFGIVAYRMLAGQLPFDGEDYMAILMQQMGDPPPPVRAIAPELPAEVDGLLSWLLAKDPSARPPSLAAAMKALETIAVKAGVTLPSFADSPESNPLGMRLPTPGMGTLHKVISVAETVAAGTPPSPTVTGEPRVAAIAASDAAEAVTGSDLVAARPRRRVWGFALAALATVLVAVGAVVAVDGGSPAGSGSSSSRASAVATGGAVDKNKSSPAQAAEAAALPAAPVVAPDAAPATSAVKPTAITVSFRGAPKDLTVYRKSDGSRLAGTDSVILLQDSRPVTLVLKASGYVDEEVEVVPAKDVSVEVRMKRRGSGRSSASTNAGTGEDKPKPPPRAPRTGDKDSLEDPFAKAD